MRADVHTPPPEPKPEAIITLTMVQDEAEKLYKISGWDITIPRAINGLERGDPRTSRFKEDSALLNSVHRALGAALREARA